MHGPYLRYAQAVFLIASATAVCAGQSATGDVIGVWQDRGTTMTLRSDGTATRELHLPRRRSQAFIGPQHGTYKVEGPQLHFEWQASRELPEAEETCAFSREQSRLRLRCDGWAEDALYQPAPENEPSELNGLLLQVTTSAAILTIALGAGLLGAFRRKIQTLMKHRPTTADAGSIGPSLSEEVWRAGLGRTSRQRAKAGMSRLARVYAIAGACAIVPLIISSALAYGARMSPGLMVSLGLVFAWPILIIVKEVTSYSWRRFRRLVILYAFLFLSVGVFLQYRDASFPFWKIGQMWVIVNAIPTLFMLLLANRTLRAIRPCTVFCGMDHCRWFLGITAYSSRQHYGRKSRVSSHRAITH